MCRAFCLLDYWLSFDFFNDVFSTQKLYKDILFCYCLILLTYKVPYALINWKAIFSFSTLIFSDLKILNLFTFFSPVFPKVLYFEPYISLRITPDHLHDLVSNFNNYIVDINYNSNI